MTALEAIGELEEIKARLSEPQLFYAQHLDEWRELARGVTRDTLVALRPPDTDANAWAAGVETAVARVTAYLLAGDEDGILIAMGAAAPDAVPEDPRFFEISGISVSDVERWVRESRDGTLEEPLRKRLGAIDEGKSDLQIAWRILYALKLRKPGAVGLENALRRFMGAAANGGPMEEILPQVLIAWMEHFAPRAQADWQAWVRAQVRGI